MAANQHDATNLEKVEAGSRVGSDEVDHRVLVGDDRQAAALIADEVTDAGLALYLTKADPLMVLRNLLLIVNVWGHPEQSYGSCLVLTSDIAELHRAFATGMRTAYGKVLMSGMPRMTRPRARKNSDGSGGFSVIDPGGNWIRVVQNAATTLTPVPTPAGRLANVLANAIVLADSNGDVRQAVRIISNHLNAISQAVTRRNLSANRMGNRVRPALMTTPSGRSPGAIHCQYSMPLLLWSCCGRRWVPT